MVGNGAVQVSENGGTTTLHIGTDATPGADVRIELTGRYLPEQFLASGTDLTVVPTVRFRSQTAYATGDAPPVGGGRGYQQRR